MSGYQFVDVVGIAPLPGSGVQVTLQSTNFRRLRIDWGDGTVQRGTFQYQGTITHDYAGDAVDDGWRIAVVDLFDPARPYELLRAFIDLNGMLSVHRNGAPYDDLVGGGSGDDVFGGRDGNDRLEGHAGLDLLDGGNGADTLMGGGEADWLLGGAGRDLLQGGAGATCCKAAPAPTAAWAAATATPWPAARPTTRCAAMTVTTA